MDDYMNVNDGSENGRREHMHEGIYLVWEDLTVLLPYPGKINNGGAPKKLLNGLSGYAQPGRILAVLGPSGSGKSTLLHSLAGRLSSSMVISTGSVLFRGKNKRRDYGGISYVTQEENFLLGTLTVRETIAFSAHLRLSNIKKSKKEIEELVEETIAEMGLQQCGNNKVGNWHLKGISEGEKKRLRIGMEILTQPFVMLHDEPTSGLDSASAFFVIWTLRNIALNNGRMVVFSIHQPSSYLFDLFDDLYLLSGGEAVYFGEAKMAVKFFDEAGFPCPTRANPSDHFLRCINSDFDKTSTFMRSTTCGIQTSSSDFSVNLTVEEIKEMLIQKYKSSEYSKRARNNIQDITLLEETIRMSNKSSRGSWWKQFCTLTRRSSINMTRDLGYYWLRIVFYILVALTAGTIFFDIGTSNNAIIERAKCDAFVYGFMICLSIGGLPFFIEELKVSNNERLNKHYGEAAFVVSNFLSSLPFLVVISVCSGAIIYNMVHFRSEFSHFCYFCINLFCCISAIESLLMIVALLVPNLLMSISLATGLSVLMMMASEISRLLPDLPRFFWRYPMSYISFASWAIQGEYKNDMVGVEFDGLVPGDPKQKGEKILETVFGIPLDHSKWWDLAAVFCILIINRLLFFVVLKYKDTAVSLFRKLCSKRITLSEAGSGSSSSKMEQTQQIQGIDVQ